MVVVIVIIKVILWCILSYLNRVSLREKYPLMLINMSLWTILEKKNSGIFHQFVRKLFFSPEFWGASGLENNVDGLPPSTIFYAGIKYTVKLCIDSYWLSVMGWSGRIIWTFFLESCNSNQNLAIFHPNWTHTVYQYKMVKVVQGEVSKRPGNVF